MKKIVREKKALRLSGAGLDELIEKITVDAYGEQEQLWAFWQAFQDHVAVPVQGSLASAAVLVLAIEYDGNERRGLTAKCRAADGREYVVAAADVMLAPGSEAARYLAAYRKWMGLTPYSPASNSSPSKRRTTSERSIPRLRITLQLVVLSRKQKAAFCSLPGGAGEITLRATRLWDAFPGEIVVVRPSKQWIYAGKPHMSGKIESSRLDVAALDLVPLKLERQGDWDPAQQYWGEPGEPIDQWAKPIILRGCRPEFEMEQVLPGLDPDDLDPDADPIGQAVDHAQAGDIEGAYEILMDLCQADLRCLDAHAHLGNIVFDSRPEAAIRHYEVGFRIGELSLGKRFDGVLPWGWIDNRPFLRCMHGFGLCLWRLKRFKEAAAIFDRMLWLNPSDNQGARFLVADVAANVAWEDSENR